MWLEQTRRDVITLAAFGRKDLVELFRAADRLRQLSRRDQAQLCRDRILATLFYQPSTRTRLSFESAILLLGGSYLAFGHPEMTKSSAGETLEDTVRVVSGYADALVVRHPRDDAAEVSASLASVPVVNGGCGTREHPTQALVDLYSMHVALGTLDGLTIGLLGDLATQRTVNSLAIGLSRFGVSVHVISHPSRGLRSDTAMQLDGQIQQHISLDADVVAELDVLYVIRIDRQRTQGGEHYEELRGDRRVRAADLRSAKAHLIVLNPLPRDDELHPDVDSTPYAYYFRQAHLGRDLRAALVNLIFGTESL